MKTLNQWFSKLVIFITLLTFTSSAFATGGTLTFTNLNPTAIPTLSGTMLIVLSLLLFVVAVKISRQKGSNAGKFFVMCLGLGALISGTGGLKLFSDLHASVPTPIIVNNAGSFDIPDDGNIFQNTSGQPLNFTIQGDGEPNPSVCGYDIVEAAPSFLPMFGNTAPSHSGELPVGHYLLANCTSSGVFTESDARMKQNVKYLTELDSSLKLYSFTYRKGFGLDTKTPYVGVMAQDLLQDSRYKHAVQVMGNGYYAVNYSALGLRMINQNEWQHSNKNVFIKPVNASYNSIISH